MPELPEVETVRRVLFPHLREHKITDVRILNAQVIAASTPEKFALRVKGQTVADMIRRGKYLQLFFAGGDRLTVHLRMTGCLTIEPRETPLRKHTHVCFQLDDGNELRYEDVRRLGKFWFTEKGGTDISGAEDLGIEPFDGALTAQYLHERCAKSKKPVKQMLLDQSVIAGIGNIYADEILFAANIRPDKPCRALSDEESERLAAAIPERLAFFIDKNALTFAEYSAGRGKEYRNTPYFQVYGRSGAPCAVCGTPLQRAVLGGRSTVFCPHCQK